VQLARVLAAPAAWAACTKTLYPNEQKKAAEISAAFLIFESSFNRPHEILSISKVEPPAS
jgi:hypothetical protein